MPSKIRLAGTSFSPLGSLSCALSRWILWDMYTPKLPPWCSPTGGGGGRLVFGGGDGEDIVAC
jgi:hypothetical protein